MGPRDKLALHTASINVFLMTLSHGSLGRLEFLAKHARPSLSSLVPPSPMSGNNASIYSGTRGVGGAHDSTGFSIWEALGKDLYEEGITHQQIEKHQEELKAYLRYLIKGETPFWNAKSGEPRSRCAPPSYRSPTLPTPRSIVEGLERHRKERESDKEAGLGPQAQVNTRKPVRGLRHSKGEGWEESDQSLGDRPQCNTTTMTDIPGDVVREEVRGSHMHLKYPAPPLKPSRHRPQALASQLKL